MDDQSLRFGCDPAFLTGATRALIERAGTAAERKSKVATTEQTGGGKVTQLRLSF